jgi:hypothetical protein
MLCELRHMMSYTLCITRLINIAYVFLFILNFQLVYISLVHSRQTESTLVFPLYSSELVCDQESRLKLRLSTCVPCFSQRPIAFDCLFAFIDHPTFCDRALCLSHHSCIANYKNNSSSSPFFIYRKGYSPTRTLSHISGSLLYILFY